MTLCTTKTGGAIPDYSIASDGNVVFSSDDWGAPGDDPCGVYGLEPCGMSSCGLMEAFFVEDGCSWYAGGMAFYSDKDLIPIFFNPDFDGDGYFDYNGFSSRTAMVSVEGKWFVVIMPVAYADQCSYQVKPEGDLVVEYTGRLPGTPWYGGGPTSATRIWGRKGRHLSLHPNPTATSFSHRFQGQESLKRS